MYILKAEKEMPSWVQMDMASKHPAGYVCNNIYLQGYNKHNTCRRLGNYNLFDTLVLNLITFTKFWIW